jgi:predicted pyridoxine 5'-phosphate oxidase superfamily flavin-nucleotide-binding protein
MSKLPPYVVDAWKAMSGPAVLSTVNEQGGPNTVYVTNIRLLDNERIAIVDNVFHKTRDNILAGSPGSFLFITETAAYQIKGRLEYHRDGAVLEESSEWANPEFETVAVVVLHVEEVYKGAEKLA